MDLLKHCFCSGDLKLYLKITFNILCFLFFLSQLEPSGVEVGRNKLLQWQLRESKHLTEKVCLSNNYPNKLVSEFT